MTPPRAPRRLSWAIAGRVAGKALQGFMLVLLVALVAWPERREYSGLWTLDGEESNESWGLTAYELRRGCWHEVALDSAPPFRHPPIMCRRGAMVRFWMHRDASLSLLPDLLGMCEPGPPAIRWRGMRWTQARFLHHAGPDL